MGIKTLFSAAFAAFSICVTAQALAFVLPDGVTEEGVVSAVGEPVLRKSKDEDYPGCMLTRYKFGDEFPSMTLEFRCKKVNVAWTHTGDAGYEERSAKVAAMATRAVIAISGGIGIEVEKAMAGQVFRGKSFDNGLSLRGSCVGGQCLLSFE